MATYWDRASGLVLLDTSEDLCTQHIHTQIELIRPVALHTHILASGPIIIDHNGITWSSPGLMDADGLGLAKHLVTSLTRHPPMHCRLERSKQEMFSDRTSLGAR